ncbi:hypothetical protein Fot_43008 [Forsythia ovata]|uniref:Uncharacterized protein n=1 Tax=Forsythia ovata TaxID=205694 RepID=A0ABD1RNB1_9LAMI
MSSENDDSQNQLAAGTDHEISGEVPSSPKGRDEFEQRPTGKKITEGTDEALGQKRKAPEDGERLSKDASKTRRTKEVCRTSLNPTKGATNVGNSSSLSGRLERILAGHAELKTIDTKDDDELRSENRVLRSKIALANEARARTSTS